MHDTVRSYIDLTYWFRVVYIHDKNVSEDLRRVLKDCPEGKEASKLKEITGDVIPQEWVDTNVFFHETYHFWQALRLPFVYMASIWSFLVIKNIFFTLNKSEPDLHKWHHETPGVLSILVEPLWVRLDRDEASFSSHERSAGHEQWTRVTPLDLLETACSIAEWQVVEAPASLRIDDFMDWSKCTPSYDKGFRVLRRILRSDALRLYLPLCNKAFHSTDPVRTFFKMAYHYREQFGLYWTLTPEAISARVEAAFRSVDFRPRPWPSELDEKTVTIQDLPYEPLPMARVIDLKAGSWPHPTLGKLVKEWERETAARPATARVLDFPAALANERQRCSAAYQPITLFRLDMRERNIVIPWGNFADAPVTSLIERAVPGTLGSQFLLDMFTEFGAVRRACDVLYKPGLRFCRNSTCPEYEYNYCNSWIFMHEDHRDCKFTSHFEWMREVTLKFQKQGEEDRRSKDMDEQTLCIKAGFHAEELIKYITENLTREERDKIDITRGYAKQKAVAQEPITIAIVLVFGAKAAGAAGAGAIAIKTIGLVDSWLKMKQEELKLEQEELKLKQEEARRDQASLQVQQEKLKLITVYASSEKLASSAQTTIGRNDTVQVIEGSWKQDKDIDATL